MRVRRAALRRIHVEGHPRLDVRDAHREVTAGRPNVLWRDQAGAVCGRGVASIGDGQLAVSASFRAMLSEPARESIDVLVLETVVNDTGARHYFTSCPVCHKRVRVLAGLRGSWSCVSCQRLGHRSMMIGSVARRTEKLARLEHEIGGGRPRGMHESTYQRLREDRALLKAELQDELSTPSPEYEEVAAAIWLAEPPSLPNVAADDGDGRGPG